MMSDAKPEQPNAYFSGQPNAYFSGPMWSWFGLSYGSYLVIPRMLLCGMPEEWQQRMVDLLDECREVYDVEQIESCYDVHLTNGEGARIPDPFTDYRHPSQLPYRDEEDE